MPEGMGAFLAYHRRMLALQAGVCLAAAAALFAAFRGDLAWVGGFSVGAAAQLLKFGVFDLAAVKRIAAIRDGAAAAQLKSTFLALLLFGGAIAAAHHLNLNIWALAAGIFLPRLVLLADAYIRPNPFGDGSKTEPAAGDENDA